MLRKSIIERKGAAEKAPLNVIVLSENPRRRVLSVIPLPEAI